MRQDFNFEWQCASEGPTVSGTGGAWLPWRRMERRGGVRLSRCWAGCASEEACGEYAIAHGSALKQVRMLLAQAVPGRHGDVRGGGAARV